MKLLACFLTKHDKWMKNNRKLTIQTKHTNTPMVNFTAQMIGVCYSHSHGGVAVVDFSSCVRIWGECLTIHSPPALFFLFFLK